MGGDGRPLSDIIAGLSKTPAGRPPNCRGVLAPGPVKPVKSAKAAPAPKPAPAAGNPAKIAPAPRPLILALDTSGSMRGECIASLQAALDNVFAALRTKTPEIGDTPVSVITFDRAARVLLPPTPVSAAIPPRLDAPDGGPTMLGAALELAIGLAAASNRAKPAPPKPNLFVLTDGRASDVGLFKRVAANIAQNAAFGAIHACAIGPKGDADQFAALTPNVTVVRAATRANFLRIAGMVAALATP